MDIKEICYQKLMSTFDVNKEMALCLYEKWSNYINNERIKLHKEILEEGKLCELIIGLTSADDLDSYLWLKSRSEMNRIR